MDYYGLFTLLVGARDGNLPPYKDARLKRYKSVQKVMELMVTASKLAPSFPVRAITLDPLDPEWDDIMPFPVMDYTNYALFGLGVLGNFWFYAYNYNTLTANFRFRNVRYFFPVVNALLIGRAFYKYNNNLLRVNLFDEYNWLRAQELVQQNEYLLKHEGTSCPTQTSSGSSGGPRTSPRRSTACTGRPTTTRPPTSRTPRSCCRTSSIGTSTQRTRTHSKSSPSSASDQ